MERNIKRFLSLVLAFVMVFGMMPANVFAVEDNMCDTCGSSLYVTGWCPVCNTGCDHSAGYMEGVCVTCNAACTHVWDSNSCTVCHLTCYDCQSNHNIEGKCKTCGNAVGHTFNWYDDNSATCEICGAPNPDVVAPEEPEPPQVTAVAQINGQGYETLADAIAAVQNGETIELLTDISDNVTITQKKNVAFTIEGNGHTYSGEMTLKGISGDNGQALTIQNVNFERNGNISIVANDKSYLRNLTVDRCSFSGANYYAMSLRHVYDITIKNTTAVNSGYGFFYAPKAVNGLEVDNVEVTGTGYGFNLQYPTNAINFKNMNLDVAGFGLIFACNAKGNITVEDSTIKADTHVTVHSKGAAKCTLTFKGENTLISEDGEWLSNGNEAYFDVIYNGDADEENDFTVVTPVKNVAQIGEQGYETLADAIAAVQNGETIVLLTDSAESVTIKQVANMSFTIDGNGKTYSGTITIDGNKRSTGKETLTIKNVNFVVSSSGIYTTDKTYAHNITVDNCTFTGVEGAAYAYGIALRAAYNVTVSNSKGENLYGFIYAPKAVTGITVDTVEVNDSVVGMYLQSVNQKPAVFKNLNLNVTDSGVTIASDSVTTATFEDCSIVAPIPVKVQKNSNDRTVNLTFIGSNNFGDGNWLTIEGTTADIVVDLTEDTNLDIGNVIYEEGVYGIVTEGEKHTFTELPSVAAIGDKEYKTIQAAVDAAQSGETVKLIDDVTLTEADRVTSTGDNVMVYVADKDITLDMNGKTISLIHEDTFAAGFIVAVIEVADGAGLTVTGNGTIDVDAYDGEYNKADIAYTFFKRGTTGHLTIQNGTYHMDNSADSMIYTHGDRIVTVNGGTFILDTVGTGNNECPWIFNTQGSNEKSIVVTGGTYNTDVSDQYWEAEVHIPDGYICEQIADDRWEVHAGNWMAQNLNTGKNYKTLADAIAEVQDGETIILLDDCDEDVTIKQQKNLSFTIDGEGKTYTGTISIDGSRGSKNTETLTIQNVNFVVDGIAIDAYEKNNYAHNITIDNCTFVGTDGTNYDYGVRLRHVYNITVTNTTGTGLFELVYGIGAVTGFTAENVTVTDSYNGIWLSYVNSTADFKNVTTNVQNGGVGFYTNASGTATFDRCVIDKVINNNTTGTGTMKLVFNDAENNLAIGGNGDRLTAVLNKVDATLTAIADLNVTSGVEGYFVVYENGVYRLVQAIAQNTNTGKIYGDLSDGLKEAVSRETVILLAETAEELVLVPAGVTFDLNGHVVEANNVLSFGIVKDSAETVGGIKIDKDTTKAFTKLQPENGGYLPIYDTRDGMYKFFEYKLVNAGAKKNGSAVKFGFQITFTNTDAYGVLAETGYSGITLTAMVSWTDMSVPGIEYQFDYAEIQEYAASKAVAPSKNYVVFLSISGLENLAQGDFVSAAPVLTTVTEVACTNEAYEYIIE